MQPLVVSYRDLEDSSGNVWRITVDTDGTVTSTSQGAGSADDWFLPDVDGTIRQVQVATDGTLFTTATSGDVGPLFFDDGTDWWGLAVATDGTLSTAVAAGFPTVAFEAAFGVNPGTVPAAGDWVDLTDRIVGPAGTTLVSWGGGRHTELDRMEALSGDVLLENTDRALDPTYTSSPYYPDVKPMTRVRLRAEYGGMTIGVFEGFVESWPQEWQNGVLGQVPVRIVDGTKLIALARTSASYSEHASGTRVGELLDAAGWPSSKRALDAGQSNVQAVVPDRQSVMSQIRDTEEAESGIFFIGPDGDATFRDRRERILGESAATFGDAAGELPYDDLVAPFDDEKLWNDIAVKPEGITIERTEDATSIGEYGRRSLPEFGTLITSALEAADRANWELNRLKDPRLRIENLQLSGHHDPKVMVHALSRTFGDRVTVRRRPHSIGDPIEQVSIVENIRHEITSNLEWKTTWGLSPASTDAVWLVGVEGFSEVGETTRLGY